MTQTTHIYLRVSTEAQDVANQMVGINAYLKTGPNTTIRTWQDTESGKTPWKDRKLGEIIRLANHGDILLVSEISRLARSTLQVLEILKYAADRGIIVHAVKSNLTMDGSMQSTIVATMLGLAAEIEREFISARTKESLARRKDAGLPMGRPCGIQKRLPLDAQADNIDKWHAAGLGKRSIAKLLGCAPATLYLWIGRNRPDWVTKNG